jgi:arsenite oxidase small subunit
LTEGAGDSKEPKKGPEDGSRRDFLKLAAAVSGALAIAGIASIMKAVVIPEVPGSTMTTTIAFPRVKVSSLGELTVGTAIPFDYPLDSEPNYLVKLGTKAEGGVGPEGDIVAFSDVCQHLGCNWAYVAPGQSPKVNSSYVAPSPVGYCPCHGSVFDLANGANVIGGPSPRPVPQVQLEVDSSGDIYAVGMGPPAIFGHDTGSEDVSNDLQGGNLVTTATS